MSLIISPSADSRESLTLEFFSTYKMKNGDLTFDTAMEFSLGVSSHHKSISRFTTPRPPPTSLPITDILGEARGKVARICQGPYITRLADRLGVSLAHDPETLAVGPPFILDDMIHMGTLTGIEPRRFVEARELVMPPKLEGLEAEHV
ncbi:hypothetical protein L1987_13838 [Smallanthus sonchifolius]|uniref:Uncharacterized protein n=1 Tax=Smallanthus sonchifolius TaxID=185202 RepID=A0ACB9JHJ8_9ASTR|nr:hypothetical protein L1987_13838 [Smallanthus sonchifolius]